MTLINFKHNILVSTFRSSQYFGQDQPLCVDKTTIQLCLISTVINILILQTYILEILSNYLHFEEAFPFLVFFIFAY